MNICITHNAPTWDIICYDVTGEQSKRVCIEVELEVHEDEQRVYAVCLTIQGHYYCSGSENFDIDDMQLDIVQDCCDYVNDSFEKLDAIYTQLVTNHARMFRDTVLDWQEDKIIDALCQN